MDFVACMDDLCSRFIINNPYEEFSSFERVVFQIEQAHWFYEDFYRKRYGLIKYSLERFVELVFHHCPSLQPYAAGVDSIYRDFKQYKSSVPVCGCILINPQCTKVTFAFGQWRLFLFFFPSKHKVVMVQGFGAKSWGFPRGKINKDEPPSSCALREVLEETGYDASANLLLDDYIDFTNRKQAIRLYLCPDVAEDTVFETRTRNEIKSIKWFKIEQLPMSFEARKQPGTKLFNVPPVLVSQLRSWVKKRKSGNRATPSKGKKKKKGKQQQQVQQVQQQQQKRQESDPNFPTDSEISGRTLVERDLVPWEPSDDDNYDSADMQLNKSTEGWNQWEANHQKFGFVSTYDPEAYTTKLDLSKAEYADKLLAAYGIRPPKAGKKKGAAENSGIPAAVIGAGGGAVTIKKTDKQQQQSEAKEQKKGKAAVAPQGHVEDGVFKINTSSVLDAFDE